MSTDLSRQARSSVRARSFRRLTRRSYHFLSFPHILRNDETGAADHEDEPIARHPDFEAFKEGLKQHFHRRTPQEGGHDPHGGVGRKGNMRVQVCRSSADCTGICLKSTDAIGSHGILTEDSIQRAYIQMITESSHCICASFVSRRDAVPVEQY